MTDFFTNALTGLDSLTEDANEAAERALRVDEHRDRIDSEKAAGSDRLDPVVRRKMVSRTWDIIDQAYRLPSDLSEVLGGWLYSLDDQDAHDWFDLVVHGYGKPSSNKQELLTQLRAYKNRGL
jgi:hypothetical protein